MSDINVLDDDHQSLTSQIEEQVFRLENLRDIATRIRDEELLSRPTGTDSETLSAEINSLSKLYADRDFESVCCLCCDIVANETDNVDVYNFLGAAWKELGHYELAETAYLAALKLEPNNGPVRSNLGVTLSKLNRYEEALSHYDLAVKAHPGNAVITYNRANTLRRLGRISDAAEGFLESIQIDKTLSSAWNNLTAILMDTNQEAAEVALREALNINPENLDGMANFATYYLRQTQYSKAMEWAEALLDRQPTNQVGLSVKAMALSYISMEPQLERLKEAVVLNGDSMMTHSNLCLFSNYTNYVAQAERFSYHQAFGEQFEKAHVVPTPEQLTLVNKKIRIGYVSPDFNTHSVAYFFEPLLKHHNKDKFEVFCYYNQAKVDQTTERMMQQADHWRPIVGLSDESVVKLVQEDGIHILVDLAGHTGRNNLTAFAYKPAPIQVSWLGYPNTTGLKAVDYRFTDDIADPVGDSEQFHTETLVRLPQGMWCYGGNASIQPHTELPFDKNGYITFGSFNDLAKLTPDVIKAWATILKATPNAKLLLKARQLVEEETQERLIELFKNEGIDKNRLILKAFSSSKSEHFDLYGEIDLALDTFPFNGATTTCEALWMGVPVLTIRGDRHVARVGASLLHRVDLDQLIAETTDEYIAKATSYTKDPNALRELRFNMRERVQSSPLCDAKSFAHSVEQKFSEMWGTFHTVGAEGKSGQQEEKK
jgi:protein O-GlcNAc transferase